MEITVKSSENQLGMGPGYVVTESKVNHLIGRLLTLAEALGLSEKQEKSYKDLVSQEVWKELEGASHIDGSLLTSVHNLMWDIQEEEKKRQMNSTENTPVNYIEGEYEVTFVEKE